MGERTLHVSPMYRNPGNVYLWNPESWASKSVLNESGIPLIIGIKNPRLSWITLYGASLLRSAEAPRGMAQVIVEIRKRVLEPVRKGETRGPTC